MSTGDPVIGRPYKSVMLRFNFCMTACRTIDVPLFFFTMPTAVLSFSKRSSASAALTATGTSVVAVGSTAVVKPMVEAVSRGSEALTATVFPAARYRFSALPAAFWFPVSCTAPPTVKLPPAPRYTAPSETVGVTAESVCALLFRMVSGYCLPVSPLAANSTLPPVMPSAPLPPPSSTVFAPSESVPAVFFNIKSPLPFAKRRSSIATGTVPWLFTNSGPL